MSFQLFPYATTSRWKIWKQRVFDCSTLKGEQAAHLALPGSKTYKSFTTSLPALPEHVQDNGPSVFYDEAMSSYSSRLKAFSDLCGLGHAPSSLSRAVLLDMIGDQLTQALTPPTRKLGKNRDIELWEAPAWNSIRIDLGLFIGEQLIQEFPRANPRWVAPSPRDEPCGPWDYPELRLTSNGKANPWLDADLFEEDLRAKVLKAYGNRRDEDFLTGGWLDICEAVFEQNNVDHEEHDMGDFSPTILNRNAGIKADDIIKHVFDTAGFFISTQWLKRFASEHVDPYYADTLLSLGDCVRPDVWPNWAGSASSIDT